jgi:hypothetical protein
LTTFCRDYRLDRKPLLVLVRVVSSKLGLDEGYEDGFKDGCRDCIKDGSSLSCKPNRDTGPKEASKMDAVTLLVVELGLDVRWEDSCRGSIKDGSALCVKLGVLCQAWHQQRC